MWNSWSNGALRITGSTIAVPLRAGLRRVEYAVDVPPYLVRFPFDGVHVKVIGEAGASQRIGPAGKGIVGPAAAVVNRAAHRRCRVRRLHDVDLAAGRPAAVDVGLGQHPERRPHAAAGRELRPHLDAPVQKRLLVLGIDTSRSIIRATERLGLAGDDQVAARHTHVLRAVVLQFVVSPIRTGSDTRFRSGNSSRRC